MTRVGRRHRLGVLAAVALAAGTALVATGDVRSAGAAGSRAVVNIGGSNQVVSFGGSVTGLQALRMVASVSTVGFGGTGEAVCSINGQGNPATPDECLVGPNGEYWSYWRAAPGATGWQYSSRGAGGTTVTDGSVEGWRYGTGGPPPFSSFCAVAGCAPPPTAAPPTTAAPVVAGSSVTTPGAAPDGNESPAPGDPTGSEATPSDGSSGAPTGDGAQDRPSRDGNDEQAAGPTRRVGDDGGGSPVGIVTVGVLLAGLAAGAVVVRRRRGPRVVSG